MVLEAARKNLLEVGARVSNPFGGEVDLPNGPPKRYSRFLPDEEPVPIDAPPVRNLSKEPRRAP